MFSVRNLFVTSYKYFQLFSTIFQSEWNGNTIVAVGLGILTANFNEN